MQPTIHLERKAGYGRDKYLPNVLWVALSVLSLVKYPSIQLILVAKSFIAL
jgi:hypothetical protein